MSLSTLQVDYIPKRQKSQEFFRQFCCVFLGFLAELSDNLDPDLKMAELSELSENSALRDVTAASEVCHATRERQAAVKELAKSCPVILVVGSARSSNTRRLYETALGKGVRAHLLGSAAEFRPEWLEGVSRVGITSGASAPEELVRELCDKIHLTQKEE